MTNEQILTCAINIGEQLLINGAEISRVEDTISRICRAYGMRQSHIFSIASCIIVTLETAEGEWITQTRRILNYGTNMYRLDKLNNLSRKICSQHLSWQMVQQEYETIVESREYPLALQTAVCAMVASSFTVFFGGTLRDGLASAFVGILLKLILSGLQSMKMKTIFSNIICSVISGLGCIFVCFTGIGQNLDTIMIGNIMLLIPGVLLTNSFRDFISGDMISGLLHFSEAIITAICVAGGFIIAIVLTGGTL